MTSWFYRLCTVLVLFIMIGCLHPPSLVNAQDKWPEFELPVIPEDKDGAQVRLSRIRDSYLAVNTKADPTQAAELLVGEALTAKGYPPEQVIAMQQLLGVLVKAGVVELHPEKLATADIESLSASNNDTDTTSPSNIKPAAASASSSHRVLKESSACPICDCSTGGTSKSSSSAAASTGIFRGMAGSTNACANTSRGCKAKAVAVQAERMSILRTMNAVGLALRRAAAARAFVLYVKNDVGSYEEYSAMSHAEQEATRKELAGQLLVTCKKYGLTGKELQKYAPVIGVEIPDLTKASTPDLEALGAEMAATHGLQKAAIAMGKDLSVQALLAYRQRTEDAALRRIGIHPTPEMEEAFSNFTTEASHFITLSRAALEAKGVMSPAAESSFMNVTATADRIASTLETVNLTDAFMTATKLMIKAEPYLNATIEGKGEDDMEPWEIILRLSQLQKSFDQQRRSFSVNLKEGNELEGLLLLNQSGLAADNPIMQQIDLAAVEGITADGAIDADELRFLVERVGALSEIYGVDQFADLMEEVETNYRALKNLPKVLVREEVLGGGGGGGGGEGGAQKKGNQQQEVGIGSDGKVASSFSSKAPR